MFDFSERRIWSNLWWSRRSEGISWRSCHKGLQVVEAGPNIAYSRFLVSLTPCEATGLSIHKSSRRNLRKNFWWNFHYEDSRPSDRGKYRIGSRGRFRSCDRSIVHESWILWETRLIRSERRGSRAWVRYRHRNVNIPLLWQHQGWVKECHQAKYNRRNLRA